MYVDGLIDREKDIINVVERVGGVRKYVQYPAKYVFYYPDNKGGTKQRDYVSHWLRWECFGSIAHLHHHKIDAKCRKENLRKDKTRCAISG